MSAKAVSFLFAAALCALAPASAFAQGKPLRTFVVGIPGDVAVINSTITTDISSSIVGGQIYSTIVRLDKDGNVVPSLAKSWQIAPDGLTYTFTFYDNIKWHDGTPFTAEDVAWSLWNVNKKYNGPASGLLEAVESITAPDKTTAVFKLKYPYPPLLRGLAYFNSSTIVAKHIFDDGGDPRKNPTNLKPIGTGPFIFKEYKKGSFISMERNPDYHVQGLPHIERLVFQIIPNEASRGLALEKGDIDFITYNAMPLGEVDRLREAKNVTVAFQKRVIAGQYQAFLNTRKGPLASKDVRQALYHAMDRGSMLEKAGFGFGKVSKGGPISSEQPIFYTEQVRQYDYDPAIANKMLDEAGFPRDANGKRFSLRVSYSLAEGPLNDVARLMRSNFAAVGVDLVDQGMDAGAWRDSAFVKWDFDITMGSFASGPDPAIGAQTFFLCSRIEPLFGRNASGYCNPKVDELLNTAAQELDEAKRVQLYHQASALITEDAPHWWLWDRYYPIAFNANVVGITDDVTGYGTLDQISGK